VCTAERDEDGHVAKTYFAITSSKPWKNRYRLVAGAGAAQSCWQAVETNARAIGERIYPQM
jgi:hypothetical protein